MLQFADKAIGYLATAINTSITTVVIQTGKGSLFPALGNGLIAILKIEEPSTGAYELVKATALTTDTFTVERGYDGSTAQAFDLTAIVSLVACRNVFKGLMGRKNRFINGCFRFFDYGATLNNPATDTLVANRWKVTTAGAVGTFAISQVAAGIGDWENDNHPRFYLRWNQTVAGAAATLELEQRIFDVRQMAGQKFTVSLLGKCAASTVAIGVYVQQVFGTGGAPSATVTLATQNITLSTTLAQKEVTFSLPSVVGKTVGTGGNSHLRVVFLMPASATFDIHIANAQAERSPVATDFEFRCSAEERVLCSEYYQKSYAPAVAAGTVSAASPQLALAGANVANGNYIGTIDFPVRMRATPIVVVYSYSAGTTSMLSAATGADLAAGSGTPAQQSDRGFWVANNSGGNAVPASGGFIFHWTASAEL